MSSTSLSVKEQYDPIEDSTVMYNRCVSCSDALFLHARSTEGVMIANIVARNARHFEEQFKKAMETNDWAYMYTLVHQYTTFLLKVCKC